MSEVTFTDANFEKDVLQAKGLVMVDFFAPWCGPCKMMAPTVEKLAEAYKGKVAIGKLNVDDNLVFSEKYGIQSIPTTIFFKNGEMVEKLVGFQSEENLRKRLEELA
ncbi:MAG TPA: thioredoxin [Candidatus Gracilibacteria bacterium]|nr:thioredoxin [Candidatus Gracilibacteria bacterium]